MSASNLVVTCTWFACKWCRALKEPWWFTSGERFFEREREFSFKFLQDRFKKLISENLKMLLLIIKDSRDSLDNQKKISSNYSFSTPNHHWIWSEISFEWTEESFLAFKLFCIWIGVFLAETFCTRQQSNDKLKLSWPLSDRCLRCTHRYPHMLLTMFLVNSLNGKLSKTGQTY